jgi:prepilin-type N-terminal cleavage/methylation domain-containing protein
MNKRNGFGLIEILVVMVIIMIIAAFLLPRYLGGTDPLTKKKIASPRERAKQVATVEYTSQINQAIMLYQQDHEGENPPNLEALKAYGVTDSMIKDQVTGKPLAYDPQSGRVGNSKGIYGLGGGSSLPQIGQ